MLVISQKKGEKFHIGRDITVTIIDIKQGKVRIGIEAPPDCKVMRDSLLQELLHKNKSNSPLTSTENDASVSHNKKSNQDFSSIPNQDLKSNP